MADVDAALQWAQANPKDPRAQAVMAKAWAMQNPNDPRAAQVMQKLSGASRGPAESAAPQGNAPAQPPLSYTPGGIPGQVYQDDPNAAPELAKAGVGAALGLGGGALTEGLEGLGGIAARAATNSGVGGLQKYFSNLIDRNPDSTEGVGTGAALGGIASLGADAVGGALGGIKRLYQASKAALHPADLQDQAMSAIADATDRLRQSHADSVASQLAGKQLPVDTTRIRSLGIPEVNSTLSKYASPYGDLPSEVSMDAPDANNIRSLIDQNISYKKLGPFAQTAESAERDNQLRGLADQLRGQIHDISPELSDTFDQWSDNLNQARALEKSGQSAPLSAVSGPNFDRRALLQKVDNEAGTNLQKLGSFVSDAQNLSDAFHRPNYRLPLTLGEVAAKGMYNGAGEGNALSNPAVLQSLFGTANASSGPAK